MYLLKKQQILMLNAAFIHFIKIYSNQMPEALEPLKGLCQGLDPDSKM